MCYVLLPLRERTARISALGKSVARRCAELERHNPDACALRRAANADEPSLYAQQMGARGDGAARGLGGGGGGAGVETEEDEDEVGKAGEKGEAGGATGGDGAEDVEIGVDGQAEASPGGRRRGRGGAPQGEEKAKASAAARRAVRVTTAAGRRVASGQRARAAWDERTRAVARAPERRWLRARAGTPRQVILRVTAAGPAHA